MPGFWESNPSVLVGILHTDVTTVAWSLGLRNLQIPGNIITMAGMPYDMARNTICMRALENGFDYCMHLDSDVIPPSDAILRLLRHNQPIISGLYCRRSPPHGLPVMLRNGSWVTDYKPGSVVEVDVVGAGCLLIRRDVLEAMPPQRPGAHWFDWRVNLKGTEGYDPSECMSEDFTFCLWAKKMLGVKTLVDTSVVCKHIGFFETTFNHAQPLECNPVT